jgi:hypothetical protein
MNKILRIGCLFALALAAAFFAGRALAQEKPAAPQPKLTNTSIQILMVRSDELKLPMAFQMALYENLVEQIEKTKKFQHVYRDGDQNAANAPDLVVLHSDVFGFKQGSEEARQVTTVVGATHIKVHCEFIDKASGKTQISQDITGNVYFLGGNLRATLDFAKKAAQIVSTYY